MNKEGKLICGDSFFMKVDDKELICVVVDGFGSGLFVNEFFVVIKDLVENYVNEDV